MLFEPGQKILFIGDSITDADRRGSSRPYGAGYVSLARNLLVARYPDLHLTIVNRGVSGDTTRDLRARWQRDVLAERPDWLALKIGINDVWRSFGGNRAEAVPLPEYTANLRHLLEETRAHTTARLILLTPYMIEPDRAHPMRAAMDRYGQAVQELAAEVGAVLIDTQAAFDTALQHTTPADWAEDQVHPNAPGHAILALAFLRGVGFAL
jgi:lysophospholipase L1-like esterase